MRTVTQLASCAVLVAAIAGPLPAAGSTTDLTIGDTLELEYAYPNVTTIFDTTGTFTYTGPGQTALINSGITELDILSNNQIEFLECGVDNGDCSQTAASYNGPLLIDLTNSNAFSDWGIQSSNANGIVSLFLASGEIGVNWQDVGVWPAPAGQVVLGEVAATPLPAALPLFATGLGGLGLLAGAGSGRTLSQPDCPTSIN